VKDMRMTITESVKSSTLRVLTASLIVILFAIPWWFFSSMFARTVQATSIAQILVGTTASALAIFACFAFLFSKLCPDELAQALDFRVGATHFTWGAIAGIGGSCVMLLIVVLMGARFGEPTYEKILSLIATCFGGALIEEIVFRGALLALFARLMPTVPAVIVVSILFALAHVGRDAIGLFSVFIAGLCYGLVYLEYRSLWAAVGMHFGWNSVLFMMNGISVWKPGPFPLTGISSNSSIIIGSVFAETALLIGFLLLMFYRRMKAHSPDS
jgi:membrane protease YdiL (CAAX protease family)